MNATITMHDVAERRATAEEELEAAELALGAAMLEGAGVTEAQQRLDAARLALGQLGSAAEALQRLEREDAEAASQRAVARALAVGLQWRAEVVRRGVELRRLYAETDAAEEELRALGRRAPASPGMRLESMNAEIDAQLEELLGDTGARVPGELVTDTRTDKRPKRRLRVDLLPNDAIAADVAKRIDTLAKKHNDRAKKSDRGGDRAAD